jgi:FAD/FMN-containing dehydrogenase
MKNPFALQDLSGGTESQGYHGAWTALPSAYAVVAADSGDIAAAVTFAAKHHVRLVVKGTGHDYLGRSTAPDSLLVWTHRMRDIVVQAAFVPRGCATAAPVPAVTIGAGARWLEAYQEVTGKHRRYVQGGGCTSVGAAGGFLQGGGFGSWSRKYGLAAASLLEAEVVTVDGTVVTANECSHPDLWWALRGGGGGTFGVVTKVTLKTHPLPDYFGAFSGRIAATSDAAFRELLERFVAFYPQALGNDHWGEQVKIRGDNSLEVVMVFQGLRGPDAERVWEPLTAWLAQHPERYTSQLRAFELPGEQMWSYPILSRTGAVVSDERAGAQPGHFWWAGDGEQVSTYWYAYTSRWIPRALFDQPGPLARVLFDASRAWTVELHFNKALADAAPEAITHSRTTAMNPSVFDAAALAIVAASGDGIPGLADHEPDRARAERAQRGVAAAMKVLRAATPASGSYVNETDYFEPDWQRSLWGAHYARLLAIKRRYDPTNVFTCHHCVGSER